MTVEPLGEDGLLAAWEEGVDATPALRGLVLLTGANPTEDASALRGWPVGRQARTLLELHSATFGELVQAHTACPACGEEIELTFSARDMLEISAPDREPLHVEAGGVHVDLRLPTVGDLLAAASASTAQEARELLLERVVTLAELDGKRVDPLSLPEDVLLRIAARLEEADPHTDLTLALTCPACDAAERVEFDICDFLWRELDARARELLEQVSAVGAAYGWPESEILRLSPARRRVYLELAGMA